MLTGQQEQRQQRMKPEIDKVAELIAGERPESDLLQKLLNKVDRQQLSSLASIPLHELDNLLDQERLPKADAGVRKLDIEMPGGVVLRNVNSDEDMNRALTILKSLNLSTQSMAQLLAGPNPVQVTPASAIAPAPPQSESTDAGTTIQEMVPRYATRNRKNLATKSLYEYGNYHTKFVKWLEIRKKKKHIPIHLITRADIADYIDDLLNDGLSQRTVSQKYLPAISGLFELAQTMGLIPEGQLVSRGHKIYSKADARKAKAEKGSKAFNDDELKKMFHPLFLAEAEKPADFWLPLLGLFTGARLNELCQLDTMDIQNHNGIWAIRFVDDAPDKSLKTNASNRLIPIHPTLLELGFLDYVTDAKKISDGRKLFPYLSYSEMDGYAATPSQRWGDYLDSIGITDKQKVFHSFRSTCNTRIKNSGVDEETRCQYVGHEHDTVNSAEYSDPHELTFLLDNVVSKLGYPLIDFAPLKYTPGQFSEKLAHLYKMKIRALAHKEAKERRANATKQTAPKAKPRAASTRK